MSDIAITAASVVPVSGAVVTLENGIFGATLAQGKVVYQDPTTKKYGLADSNSATEAIRKPRGIAINAGSDGQPGTIHRKGKLTIGATLIPGVAYYLSDTPGGICPVADIGSGEYSVYLGIAISASVLDVNIQESGVAL